MVADINAFTKDSTLVALLVKCQVEMAPECP